MCSVRLGLTGGGPLRNGETSVDFIAEDILIPIFLLSHPPSTDQWEIIKNNMRIIDELPAKIMTVTGATHDGC